jgi:hypothetical protein
MPAWAGFALALFGPVTIAGMAVTARWRISRRGGRHRPRRVSVAWWAGVMLTLAGLYLLGLGVAGAVNAWLMSMGAVSVLLSPP